ncbi:MAG: SUMF1/EgtB/PvdO family nonheme iron enzyme [Candidatus Sumerlaeota bacterium]|nr:SUMF1/EgtB/PvdO family nonheme iron enzyme [Candidatus Sumerlaeota bacterium]
MASDVVNRITEHLLGRALLTSGSLILSDTNTDAKIDASDILRALTSPTLPSGAISVNVTPAAAQWTLAGPAGFEGNGQIYTGNQSFANAFIGDYTWAGLPLAGYNTPTSQTQTLISEGNIVFAAEWTTQTGAISVNVTPTTAQWTLAGPAGFEGNGQIYTGNQSFSNAFIGDYTWSGLPLAEYNTPTTQTQTLISEGNIVFTCEWTTQSPGMIEMVSISTGTFTMGNSGTGDDSAYGYPDELPTHTVTLSAYQIGKYDVTNGQYCDVLNWALAKGYVKGDSSDSAYSGGDVYASGQLLLAISNSSCQIIYSSGSFTWKSRTGSHGANYSMRDHPVVIVTWYGGVAFCNWQSEKEGLAPCYDLATGTRGGMGWIPALDLWIHERHADGQEPMQLFRWES